MEMEMFLASRVSASKHMSSMQTAHLNFNSDNRMNMEDLQGDDDSRAYFPCPFCYVEIELRVLCNHLQEEHCFGLNNAVCPLCAANLGRDVLGHFTKQHSHSVKRKRKSQKSGFWSSYPSTVGRDFREMSSLFGLNSISGRTNVQDPAPDPLLSPFLSKMQIADPKADSEDDTTLSCEHNITSDKAAISNDLSEQDYQERGRRAAFAQELILSAIF